MAGYFIAVFFLFSSFAMADDKEISEEQMKYLETVNYRLTQLHYLSAILRELQIIRCQNDYTEECEKILNDDANQDDD